MREIFESILILAAGGAICIAIHYYYRVRAWQRRFRHLKEWHDWYKGKAEKSAHILRTCHSIHFENSPPKHTHP